MRRLSCGRRAARKAVDIRCSVRTRGDTPHPGPRQGRARRQRIVDLSPLGAWLGTRHPLAIGELIDVSLPGPEGALSLRAEVMWTRRGRGMAVEFVGVSEATRHVIAAMLASAPPARASEAAFHFADGSFQLVEELVEEPDGPSLRNWARGLARASGSRLR